MHRPGPPPGSGREPIMTQGTDRQFYRAAKDGSYSPRWQSSSPTAKGGGGAAGLEIAGALPARMDERGLPDGPWSVCVRRACLAWVHGLSMSIRLCVGGYGTGPRSRCVPCQWPQMSCVGACLVNKYTCVRAGVQVHEVGRRVRVPRGPRLGCGHRAQSLVRALRDGLWDLGLAGWTGRALCG